MVKGVAVDLYELGRFIVSGVIATLSNLIAVWVSLSFLSFEMALVIGIAAGLMTSFVLSKVFAFRSPSWTRAIGEANRFLLVYFGSCTLYWVVAMVCGRYLLPRFTTPGIAELGGVLFGAGMMTLTSYFGHRFFTYKTYRRSSERVDIAR